MAKYKKIITAGPLTVECVYPAQNPRDSDGVRRGKRQLSSQAQQRMNMKYAYQKLELEMAANFGRKDLFITFTYDNDSQPANRGEANKNVQSVFRKLRQKRKVMGNDLRYIYATEHKHGDGRWHHHALINAVGEDFDMLRSIWKYGIVFIQRLVIDRDHTYEQLAKYFCKEQRDKVGTRLWSCSRNLKKPEKDCFRVPNDTPLTPPAGVMVLEDTGDVATVYGHYRYIKYIARGMEPRTRARAKRRRRRKAS